MCVFNNHENIYAYVHVNEFFNVWIISHSLTNGKVTTGDYFYILFTLRFTCNNFCFNFYNILTCFKREMYNKNYRFEIVAQIKS